MHNMIIKVYSRVHLPMRIVMAVCALSPLIQLALAAALLESDAYPTALSHGGPLNYE
jgi:hypothetical protein